MSAKEEEVSQVPDQLMEQLLKGYDSLHAEFKLLNDQHRELENRLAWAKQQYSDVLKRFSPETASQESRTFVDELEEAGACQQNGQIDWLECLSKGNDADRRTRAFNIRVADDAREKLRNRQQEMHGVRIWNGRSAEKKGSISSKLRNELEHDYTTPGTPSRLGCPFAVPAGVMHSRRPSTLGQRSLPTPRSSLSRTSGSVGDGSRKALQDPIRAESCGNDPGSAVASVEGSSAVCPIRFLNQHSPEEVAQYFEKHKHEIPRSHAVCIKRYQSNSEQIRQLDAKYGSLVSMLQGLGQKHQPMFPEKPEDEEAVEPEKKESVTKWARDVTESLGSEEDVQVAQNPPHEERTPHFDRPMKEVRVGESPSRPWGISVPAKYEAPASVCSEGSAATASPQELSAPQDAGGIDGPLPSPKRGAQCPFDHNKIAHADAPKPKNTDSKALLEPQPAIISTVPGLREAGQSIAATPQMTFHGPVFIGYPMEQAIQLLRESGFGVKN
ncbi:hypothetical protein NA57DRAFT_51129 [Rhizodiscina lignyota]|uniref:Uncharacterized protein n=1 Tax=Rhizodiscina lignyota TaxID=1504668 RepID=A0A9P4MAQ8_9PEZI|nr:hypothetical protein NA57DRAFT_51129 [Rhizodiscina lignyota]